MHGSPPRLERPLEGPGSARRLRALQRRFAAVETGGRRRRGGLVVWCALTFVAAFAGGWLLLGH